MYSCGHWIAIEKSVVKADALHAAEGRGTWSTGLTNWTYYDMDTDVIQQRGETCHDKPDGMRRELCIISLSRELSAKR